MGMPGEHAVAGTTPQINDIVIQGYLLSFDEGDAAAAMVRLVLHGQGQGEDAEVVVATGARVGRGASLHARPACLEKGQGSS